MEERIAGKGLQRALTNTLVIALVSGLNLISGAGTAFADNNEGAGLPWGIYTPDMKFSDVFGRSITIQKGTGGELEDPTLMQALQAKDDSPNNALAMRSVQALLNSVAPGVPSCEGLISLELPWVRILSAETRPAAGAVPAYCHVLAVIDTEINVEMGLPLPSAWNRKFLMGCGGGFLGTLGLNTGVIASGYAYACTDTGHHGAAALCPVNDPGCEFGARWACNNPERVLNFAHRGTHLAAATAKLIIQAHYDRPIKYSYYQGESGSGRPALMEAQRYPKDFDGIIAGAPAFRWITAVGLGMAWTQQVMFPTKEDQYSSRPVVPQAKAVLFDDLVHAKCDRIDGVEDGIIMDPRACHFDSFVDLPRCQAGQDRPDCFTAQQVNVMARIHSAPSNSSGEVAARWPIGGEGDSGFAQTYVIGPTALNPYTSRHYYLANETLACLVYNDPSYDLHEFDFERDVPDTAAAAALIDANDPDLKAFKHRGGKLIIQMGWADWAVNPFSAIEYYERVVDEMGGRKKTEDFARLYLVPGAGHGASDGYPGGVDYLGLLEQWVENGVAPSALIASGSGRSRPLCPYPQIPRYSGQGDVWNAANFRCEDTPWYYLANDR